MIDKTTTHEKPHAEGVQAEPIVRFKPGIKGCGDHNCIFENNTTGIHTNGGCGCERELIRHPKGFRSVQTIHFLRAQIEKYDKN